jgi:hypothetical protein
MDLDFSISWCERVSEWTFNAHWLSDISPANVRTSPSPAQTTPANANNQDPVQIAILRIFSLLNSYE